MKWTRVKEWINENELALWLIVVMLIIALVCVLAGYNRGLTDGVYKESLNCLPSLNNTYFDIGGLPK